MGVGVSGCGRSAITTIRDAFVETVKEMNVQDVVAFLQRGIRLSARPDSAAGAPESLLCVALLHIHDEASLRLRSSADLEIAGPSRIRGRTIIPTFALEKSARIELDL